MPCVIYSYNAAKRQFELAELIGIDRGSTRPTEHLVIDEEGSVLGQAAANGQPIEIPDLAQAPDHPLNADVAVAAGFNSVLVVPLGTSRAFSGSLVVLRKDARRLGSPAPSG